MFNVVTEFSGDVSNGLKWGLRSFALDLVSHFLGFWIFGLNPWTNFFRNASEKNTKVLYRRLTQNRKFLFVSKFEPDVVRKIFLRSSSVTRITCQVVIDTESEREVIRMLRPFLNRATNFCNFQGFQRDWSQVIKFPNAAQKF